MGEVIHNDWLTEIKAISEREIEGIRIYFKKWWSILSLAIKGVLDVKLDALTIFMSFKSIKLKISYVNNHNWCYILIIFIIIDKF